MAGSLNKVQIIGHLGGDPETRTAGSSKVCNFSVATTETWKDKQSGEKRERTEWNRVVVWNENLIGIIEKYVKKGDKIYVEGQLQTRKWEKDGQDHYSTEIVLSGFSGTILLLSNKGGGEQNDNAGRAGNSGVYSAQSGGGSSARTVSADLDDAIPFAPEWR